MTDHLRVVMMSTLVVSLVACAKSFTAAPTDGRDGGVVPVVDGGRVDGRAADGGQSDGAVSDGALSDGGRSDGGRGGLVPRLELVVGPGLWTRLARTIAADDEGRVYVTDGWTVFGIVGHVAEVFLTPEELDPRGDRRVGKLAVDEEGNLAVLVSTWVRVFGRDGSPIAERDLRALSLTRDLAARSPTDMLVVSRDGLVHLRDGARPAVLYDGAMLGGSPASCVAEAIGAARDRVYYLPGCFRSPIYVGARDGSAVRELVTVEPFEARFDGFVNFDGLAPHPSSGVVAMSCDAGMFHVLEDGTFTQLWSWPRSRFCSGSTAIAVSGSDVVVVLTEENAVYALRDVL